VVPTLKSNANFRNVATDASKGRILLSQSEGANLYRRQLYGMADSVVFREEPGAIAVFNMTYYSAAHQILNFVYFYDLSYNSKKYIVLREREENSKCIKLTIVFYTKLCFIKHFVWITCHISWLLRSDILNSFVVPNVHCISRTGTMKLSSNDEADEESSSSSSLLSPAQPSFVVAVVAKEESFLFVL